MKLMKTLMVIVSTTLSMLMTMQTGFTIGLMSMMTMMVFGIILTWILMTIWMMTQTSPYLKALLSLPEPIVMITMTTVMMQMQMKTAFSKQCGTVAK